MLQFDIDADQIGLLVRELGATEKQVGQSFNRALNRTAATLRKMSIAGLRSELDLRNAKAIRRRLRTIKLRGNQRRGVRLWYGTNDLRVSAFKGRPRRTRKGVAFRETEFVGGFIAKGKDGKRTIFRRRGKSSHPIVEQTLPVKDRIDVYLEDEVFPELEDIFMRHFTSDLRARVNLNIGAAR